MRGVDAHVAVGEAAAREVERQIGLAPGAIRVIESAVPEFAAERTNGHRTRPLIGTTARLDRQKGLDVLLRALPAVPDVDVEIVGDGPEREALEALARELDVAGRVHFAGWSERAREWLGRWDAFVLPVALRRAPAGDPRRDAGRAAGGGDGRRLDRRGGAATASPGGSWPPRIPTRSPRHCAT